MFKVYFLVIITFYVAWVVHKMLLAIYYYMVKYEEEWYPGFGSLKPNIFGDVEYTEYEKLRLLMNNCVYPIYRQMPFFITTRVVINFMMFFIFIICIWKFIFFIIFFIWIYVFCWRQLSLHIVLYEILFFFFKATYVICVVFDDIVIKKMSIHTYLYTDEFIYIFEHLYKWEINLFKEILAIFCTSVVVYTFISIYL